RRDLEDRRVLERRDPVDRARAEMEARARRDHLGVEESLPRLAQLELGATALDVPALVLLAVELKAERVAGTDEQDLPDVGPCLGPDQLPAPRLLHPPRGERPPVEAFEVRRVDGHARSRRRQSRRLRSLMSSVEPTLIPDPSSVAS